MTLAASTRYKLYQPVVSTDTFLVSFPLFADEDLSVFIDGVETEAYTVSSTYTDGVSTDAQIVLSSGVVDVDVEIYGSRTPRRESNYLGNSPNLAINLQLDADRLTAQQQEINRDFGSTIRVSPRSPIVSPLVSTNDGRAGRVIAFDEAGTGLVVGPTTDDIDKAKVYSEAAEAAALAASLYGKITFATWSEAISSDEIVEGMRISITSGHNGVEDAVAVPAGTYTANDDTVWDSTGNPAVQLVSTRLDFKTPSELFADERGYANLTAGQILMAAGLAFQVLVLGAASYDKANAGGVLLNALPATDGSYSVLQFGVSDSSASTQTTEIQLAIDKVAAKVSGNELIPLVIPKGTYIHGPLTNKTGVVLTGRGGVLKFADSTTADAGTSYFPITDGNNPRCGFVDLVIDGNGTNNAVGTFASCDSLTISGRYSFADNIRVYDAPDSGVMFSDAEGAWIDKIIVDGAPDVGIYVNGSEGTTNHQGAAIGQVFIRNATFGGVAFKRTASRMTVGTIHVENSGAGVSFEEFGVGTGGSPELISIDKIQLYDIGYDYRVDGAAEVGVTINLGYNVRIGSIIGRDISGPGIVSDGSANCVIEHVDLTGYTADPKTTGYKNAGIVIARREPENIESTFFKILSGTVVDFTDEGVYAVRGNDCEVMLDEVVGGTYGLRIGANCTRMKFGGNYSGTTADLLRDSSAVDTDLSKCYFPNLTGDIQQHGGQRSASLISPYGQLTPWFVGQKCSISTQAQVFVANGLANTDWRPITEPYYTTAANIADATNSVNTQGKHLGRLVWDTTNTRMMRATGSVATDAWQADGVSVTPV